MQPCVFSQRIAGSGYEIALNNEKNCLAIIEDKIAVCEKTAGLWSGNSSDLDSAYLNVFSRHFSRSQHTPMFFTSIITSEVFFNFVLIVIFLS